jgi:hypothetical protein
MTCDLWVTTAQMAECDCPNDATQAQIESAVVAASDLLYDLSGRQFPGITCEATLRPCETGCRGGSLCSCVGGHRLRLPYSPIVDVTAILIDGVAFTDYRIDPPDTLTRTDGDVWPRCQRLDRATTETDTWSIEYAFGQAPPEGGVRAATTLALELIRACADPGKCRLPAGVATVTRRGVTFNLDVEDGRVGLSEVDRWLDSVNPRRSRVMPRLRAPDDPSFVVVA